MQDKDFTSEEIKENKPDILDASILFFFNITWNLLKYCIYFSGLALICLTIFGIAIILAK